MSNKTNFSIVQVSGHQYLMQAGNWYDINRIEAEPNAIIKLKKILLFRNRKHIIIGNPFILDKCVVGVVVQHIKGKKVCVFKYKPKKKYNRKKGYRASLTRLLIKKVFQDTNYGT